MLLFQMENEVLGDFSYFIYRLLIMQMEDCHLSIVDEETNRS